MRKSMLVTYQPEFQLWQQGQADAYLALGRRIVEGYLLIQARGLLNEHNLLETFDEGVLLERFQGCLINLKSNTFKNPDELNERALVFLAEDYLPNYIYPKCFELYKLGCKDALKKFWGIAYKNLILPRARKANWDKPQTSIDDEALAVLAMDNLSNHNVDKIKNYSHFKGLISFYLHLAMKSCYEKAMAKSRFAPISSLSEHHETVMKLGHNSRLRPFPKRKKSSECEKQVNIKNLAWFSDFSKNCFINFKAVSCQEICKDYSQEVAREVEPKGRKRHGVDIVNISSLKDERWPKFIELYNSGHPKATKLMSKILVALLREQPEAIFEAKLSDILFHALLECDCGIWEHFKYQLIKGHPRMMAETAARSRAFIDQKIDERSNEIIPEMLEELKDFSRITHRRLMDQNKFCIESCLSLNGLFARAYRIVMATVHRDCKDTFFRGYRPSDHLLSESELVNSVQFETLITLNESYRKLIKNHPKLAQVLELRYFAGFTLAETAKELNLTISAAVGYEKTAILFLKWVGNNG